MARMPSTALLLPILYGFLQLHSVVGGPNGFTIKLIHRDSPASPLYPGKLTPDERLQRLVNYAKARHHQLVEIAITSNAGNRTGMAQPDVPRVGVLGFNFLYLALVGIGNFDDPPFMKYYLAMDTGSDLIWIQCEGCNSPGGNCFPLKGGSYPNSKSHTYHLKPEEPHDYSVKYFSGPSSQGELALERFSFDSDQGQREAIDNINFGCGLNQLNWNFKEDNMIAGILGMGGGPQSFMAQLGPQAKGLFGYCLQPFHSNQEEPDTFLRFGDDADLGEAAEIHTTPLVKGPNPTFYYLDLQDISIAGNHIGFENGSFGIKPDGTGGCVIDSGCGVSVMFRTAYDIVKGAIKLYLWQYNLTIIDKPPFGLDLCYVRPPGFNSFPYMTYHFGEDALEVPGEDATFIVRDKYFCLAMFPTNSPQFMAIIGAPNQVNTRILYDFNKQAMSYTKEDCAMWG